MTFFARRTSSDFVFSFLFIARQALLLQLKLAGAMAIGVAAIAKGISSGQ